MIKKMFLGGMIIFNSVFFSQTCFANSLDKVAENQCSTSSSDQLSIGKPNGINAVYGEGSYLSHQIRGGGGQIHRGEERTLTLYVLQPDLTNALLAPAGFKPINTTLKTPAGWQFKNNSLSVIANPHMLVSQSLKGDSANEQYSFGQDRNGQIGYQVAVVVPEDAKYGNHVFSWFSNFPRFNIKHPGDNDLDCWIYTSFSLNVVPRKATGKIHIHCKNEFGKEIKTEDVTGDFQDEVTFPDIDVPGYRLVSKPETKMKYLDSDQDVDYEYKSVSAVFDGSKIPKNITYDRIPITYDSDQREVAIDDQGNAISGEIDVSDGRDPNQSGWSLKVKQDQDFIGEQTGSDLSSVKFGFRVEQIENSLGNKILGSYQTVDLDPGIEAMVAEAPKGQSGGDTKVPIDDFTLILPASQKKIVDRYETTISWTFSDTPTS